MAENTGGRRTGTIAIGGKTYTVTQAAPCIYSLTQSSVEVAGGATSGTAGVTTEAICPWTAVSHAEWITNITPASGRGSATVTYSLAKNNTDAIRTGTITIGGQTFTVRQPIAPCTYALSQTFVEVPDGVLTGTVNVTTGASCEWTAVAAPTAAWITNITPASGRGNGAITYSLTANNTNAPRIGTIIIGRQIYRVRQAVPCTYSLPQSSVEVAGDLPTGTAGVTTEAICPWVAVSNAGWITNVRPASGRGNGTVTYSLVANNTDAPRTGTIAIGGQTYTVRQAIAPCTYSLSQSSAEVAGDAPSGTVDITTGASCIWVIAYNLNWITNVRPVYGRGNGTVTYSIARNTGERRTGTIAIGGQTYTVTQAAEPSCSFSLSPSSAEVSAGASNGTVNVTTGASCTWTAVASSAAAWITNVSPSSGRGNGTVTYSLTRNTGERRTGSILIGGQTYTVTQAAAPSCTYSLSPSSAEFSAEASNGTVNVTTGESCTWSAVASSSAAAWITNVSPSSGNGNGTVTYSLTRNTGERRTGSILIGGQTYTVTQAAAPSCTYSLSPSSAEATGEVSNGTVNLTTGESCTWTAVPSAAWITNVSPPSGNGNATITYSISKNTGAERTGAIAIGGQTFTVKQSVVTGFETTSPVKIFPNPAKDFVTIDLSGSGLKCVSLKIANPFGQILYELKNPGSAVKIPLKGLAGGLYFIFLQGEEKTAVQKLLVE